MPQKVQANDIKITKILYSEKAHGAVSEQVKIINNLILPIRIIFNHGKSVTEFTQTEHRRMFIHLSDILLFEDVEKLRFLSPRSTYACACNAKSYSQFREALDLREALQMLYKVSQQNCLASVFSFFWVHTTHKRVFTAALSMTAKQERQPKWPSNAEWANKSGIPYINTLINKILFSNNKE